MPADTTPSTTDRTTCSVVDHPFFGPGVHKKKLYSDDDIRRMERAFARLSAGDSPHLTPKVGLGHDRDQEFAASLGFGNVGRVVAARRDPDGLLRLTLRDIPAEVGAEINARRLDGGSIEIDDSAPDPDDPAITIPGPILTGLALLGGEQPAVKGCPPPTAVFDDGTPVPASRSPAKWLNTAAEVLARATPKTPGLKPPGLSAAYAPAYAARRGFSVSIAFSEMFQMDRAGILDQLRQKGIDDPSLSGMSDAQLKALLDQVTQSGFNDPKQAQAMFAACKAFAAAPPMATPPASTPGGSGMSDGKSKGEPDGDEWMSAFNAIEKDEKTSPVLKAMAAACRQGFSAFTKRVGMTQQAIGEIQKTAGEEKAAAMSARVIDLVDARIGRGAAPPNMRSALIAEGEQAALRSRQGEKFSAGVHAGKSIFDGWAADQQAARPGDLFTDPTRASNATSTADPGDPESDPFVRRAMQHMPGMRPHAHPLKTAAAS